MKNRFKMLDNDPHDFAKRHLLRRDGTKFEGRLSTGSPKDELVKLATEEALEGEATDAVGRDYYEHGAQPGQEYRNGYRTGRLKTAEGLNIRRHRSPGGTEPLRVIREQPQGPLHER